MYNGYRHQISNEQLTAQVEMLEETKAQRWACDALGIDRDYPSRIKPEMDARVSFALAIIDEEPDNDNGVKPQSSTPPMPYLDGGELPY